MQCTQYIPVIDGVSTCWTAVEYMLSLSRHIIIHSKTVKEHLTRLREVFTRLLQAVLKIKPAICHLMQKSVTYLGHII